MLSWPPPYQICPNPRIKHARLHLCHKYGLRLIVPKNFNPKEAIFLLQEHRLWIEKTWKRIKPAASSLPMEPFPQQINLLAVGEIWNITYHLRPIKAVLLREKDGQLILEGNVKHAPGVKHILKKWLLKKGKSILIPWLNKLSAETLLSFKGVSVRYASTRWGSCSSEKNISLNYKLLLLDCSLVEYVLLHELCHTVHFDHSKNFWNLLIKVCHDGKQLRKNLKDAERNIPFWIEA